jgi:hypothetical protein
MRYQDGRKQCAVRWDNDERGFWALLQLSGPEFRLPKQPSAYFQDRKAIIDGELVKLIAHQDLTSARRTQNAGVSRGHALLIAGDRWTGRS